MYDVQFEFDNNARAYQDSEILREIFMSTYIKID